MNANNRLLITWAVLSLADFALTLYGLHHGATEVAPVGVCLLERYPPFLAILGGKMMTFAVIGWLWGKDSPPLGLVLAGVVGAYIGVVINNLMVLL